MEQSRSSRWFAAIIAAGVVALLSMQRQDQRASYRAAEAPRSADALTDGELVQAFEAADRAWRAARTPATERDRAHASARLGLLTPSTAPPAQPAVDFFERALASIPPLSGEDQRRFEDALGSFTRGRDAFANEAYHEAREASAAAETEWSALGVPLALFARDLRIRSECSQGHPACLDNIRALRAELTASGLYPWLQARAAHAEGQTLLRQSRMHEAVQLLRHAQSEFHRLGDTASEGCMDTLLAGAYATAGEADLALSHYLESIRNRSGQAEKRRRGQLEDTMLFLLRHDYLATAEAVLAELHAAPATDAALVMESALRGILYMRLGEPHRGALNFDLAHARLDAVGDRVSRAGVEMFLAMVEAGSRPDSPHPVLERIEEAIEEYRDQDDTIWLPQLLTERGVALERRGDEAGAERDYRRAMDLLEQRQPDVENMLIGIGTAADGESPFDRAIRLLLRHRRIEGALTIAQRAAALRVSALYASSAGLNDVYRNFRDGGPGDVVKEMQRGLPGGHAAVAYHLLRDELITWVITREDIFVVTRRVNATEVVRSAEALRDCARRSCGEAAAIERVSDLLLRGWIERVPRETTLLVQPPPELQGVPFAMLRTQTQEPLFSRNGSTTAPTLRAFLRAEESDAKRAAARGEYFAAAPDPGGDLASLPLAKREVRSASAFYERPKVDDAATRASFVALAPAFAQVHFAGHVLVNEKQPLLSALAFSGSEMLYVHELNETSFGSARTVTLSACETGRTPRPTMSVANALLALNVPSVVYTLWPVSDEDAEAFAVAFHEAMARGVSRAEAVRLAQRNLMRRNPERTEAWATFALAGTPGPHGKAQ